VISSALPDALAASRVGFPERKLELNLTSALRTTPTTKPTTLTATMADSVKATKDAIWLLQQEINKQQTELDDWTETVTLPNSLRLLQR
jgi:hypothetical protein